jgi:hypothetical protein
MSNYGGRTQRLKRLSHSALRQGGYICIQFGAMRYQGPVYMRPGQSQTRMKIEIVNMFTWDRYENHKIFQFIPLARQFSFIDGFCYHVLFQCQGYSRDRSEMYFCLHSSRSEITLNSCRSEVSRLGPTCGMTWDRSELFSSRFHVNIYYK